MPPLLRRSPSSGDSSTSTRSCSIWISSFGPSDTGVMLLACGIPGLARHDEIEHPFGARFEAHGHAPVLPGDPASGVLAAVIAARGLGDDLQHALGDAVGEPDLPAQVGAGSGAVGEQFRRRRGDLQPGRRAVRSEEHTSELQSRRDLVCRLLLEKKKKKKDTRNAKSEKKKIPNQT